MKNDDLSKLRLENFGFVYQFHHLLEDMTILENVLLPNQYNKSEKKFNKDEIYKVWLNRVKNIEKKRKISLGLTDSAIKEGLKPHLKQVFSIANMKKLLNSPEAFGKNKDTQYHINPQGDSIYVELVKGAYYQKKRQVKDGVVQDTFVQNQKVINYVMQELYYQMGDLIQKDNTFVKIHKIGRAHV